MRFHVELKGERVTRYYESAAGAKRRAKLMSQGDILARPYTAVATEYNPTTKAFDEVGRATFVNGYLDDERGVLAA